MGFEKKHEETSVCTQIWKAGVPCSLGLFGLLHTTFGSIAIGDLGISHSGAISI